MSVNKHQPHVWLIAEDEANRQIAVGFMLHHAVDYRRAGRPSVAHGWTKILEVFEDEYAPLLRRYQGAHVVMLVDFDGVQNRGDQLTDQVPVDLRSRVFVIGTRETPENLKANRNLGFEAIGRALAEDCANGTRALWDSGDLAHNSAELDRLLSTVKPILFTG